MTLQESVFISATAGALVAIPLTYFMTLHFKRLNAVEARIEAESVKSFHAGRDSFIAELTVEQHLSTATKGLVWKENYAVIKERLLYKNLPITPFWEHRQQTNEHLDGEALKKVAEAASVFMTGTDLHSLGAKFVSKSLTK